MINVTISDKIPGLFVARDKGVIKAAMLIPIEEDRSALEMFSNCQDGFDGICKLAQELWPGGRSLINSSTAMYGNAMSMAGNQFVAGIDGGVHIREEPMRKIARVSLSKEEELANWKRYKKRGDMKALNELTKSFKPLVYSRVKPWTTNSPLPKSAVQAEGMRLLKMGFDTYDPDKGAALGTHVWNYLTKVHRYGYTYQNVGSLPEPRAAKVGTYQNTFEQMKDDKGREPTLAELKQELGWKMSDLKSMQKELRADLSLDQEIGPIFATNTDPATEALMATYYDADPETQLIMEYTFDEFKGKPTLNGASAIGKKLDKNPAQVRKTHKSIYNSISSILNSSGPRSLNDQGVSHGISA